jgi:hypothetical protein
MDLPSDDGVEFTMSDPAVPPAVAKRAHHANSKKAKLNTNRAGALGDDGAQEEI